MNLVMMKVWVLVSVDIIVGVEMVDENGCDGSEGGGRCGDDRRDSECGDEGGEG